MKHRTLVDAVGIAALLIAPVLFPAAMFLGGSGSTEAARMSIGGAIVVLLHLPLYLAFRKAAAKFDALNAEIETWDEFRQSRLRTGS